MTDQTSSTTAGSITTTTEPPELVMERVFDAPRALVWRAFTEPERLKQWWGPKGWTLPVCALDLRPGGVWHYCMRGPNGEEGWGKAVYREIVEPERLVYLDAFSDADGKVAEGMPQMLITVEFADHGGKTKVTSRTRFASAADLETTLGMGVADGMTETWNRLADYLATA
jgi:uncharacterized protein YndB with AHSA1/START domain